MPILPTCGVTVGPSSVVSISMTGDDDFFAIAPSELFTELTTFGTYGTGSGNLNYPYGAYVTADGSELWVCDGSNHRIARFQLDGTWVGSFGSYGTGNTQFNTPRDIAFDSSGNAYIVDFLNHRVVKYNSSGTYQTQWSTGASSYPAGIAYDAQNNYLWVASRGTGNGTIKAYNTSGVQQVTFGTLAYSPTSVGIDRRARRVYVGTTAGTLLRYSTSGSFQGALFTGDLTSNADIYVDVTPEEAVYVCEPSIDRIWKGMRTGELMSSIGTSGTAGTLAFNGPVSITQYNGYLYIVDNMNHKVHKLTSGTKANMFGFVIDYQGNIQHTGNLIHTA